MTKATATEISESVVLALPASEQPIKTDAFVRICSAGRLLAKQSMSHWYTLGAQRQRLPSFLVALPFGRGGISISTINIISRGCVHWVTTSCLRGVCPSFQNSLHNRDETNPDRYHTKLLQDHEELTYTERLLQQTNLPGFLPFSHLIPSHRKGQGLGDVGRTRLVALGVIRTVIPHPQLPLGSRRQCLKPGSLIHGTDVNGGEERETRV